MTERDAPKPTPRLPSGPFLVGDVGADGPDRWSLRRKQVALFRGVYVAEGTTVDELVLARAALLLGSSGSYISHHSAARLFGGIVPHDPDVHVTSSGARLKTAGILGHPAKAGQRTQVWRGVRTTTPLQTFLDLAQDLTLVELVVLGDSLVKRKRFSPRALVDFVAGAQGPHHRRAKRAAALVRKGVDSAMETRLRLLIVFAGLPEPTVDHRIYDRDGNLTHRFDLAYLAHGLIIEYDGKQHAESTAQWHRDLERDEQLDDWQIRRLVVVSNGIYSTPGRTLSRITKAMRIRGMKVPALKGEWRRHFPGHPGDVLVPA